MIETPDEVNLLGVRLFLSKKITSLQTIFQKRLRGCQKFAK